jgi:hypothetical protein
MVALLEKRKIEKTPVLSRLRLPAAVGPLPCCRW